MSSKLGLDWWEVVIQTFVTVCAMVVVSEVDRSNEGILIPVVMATSALIFGVRRRMALKRRPELTTGEVAAIRLEELEQRVADLEGQGARMAELEERMDFSERLLAKGGVARPSAGERQDQREPA